MNIILLQVLRIYTNKVPISFHFSFLLMYISFILWDSEKYLLRQYYHAKIGRKNPQLIPFVYPWHQVTIGRAHKIKEEKQSLPRIRIWNILKLLLLFNACSLPGYAKMPWILNMHWAQLARGYNFHWLMKDFFYTRSFYLCSLPFFNPIFFITPFITSDVLLPFSSDKLPALWDESNIVNTS